ncbi:hypothetical protein FRC07_002404 [Ceratobasidium sp. 392]|nr:hypothetical protein FRC07_002404 [Ceratobasidium sp. 392]
MWFSVILQPVQPALLRRATHTNNIILIQRSLTIDAELTGLVFEEATLGKARSYLAVARNRSTALSPIHALPPEILTKIFLMVQYGYKDKGVSKNIPPAQILAGVCSCWRRVATGTPSLWTDIRITIAQERYDYATLSLNHTSGAPIKLFIFEPLHAEVNVGGFMKKIDQPPGFFEQACRQLHSLHIHSSSNLPRGKGIAIVLKHWLKYCSAGTTKVLQIQTDDTGRFQSLEQIFDLASVECAEAVLSSLSTLRLKNDVIPWTSAAYRNLVDLQLYFWSSSKVRIPVSQLASILGSSQGLTTLKISGLEISSSDGWDVATTIPLKHLEVLYLGNLSGWSCELLFPLIPLSSCLNDLSIGYYTLDPLEASDLILEYLQNIRVRTLACIGFCDQDPQWALLLSEVVASLETLILSDFGPLTANERQPTDFENQPGVDRREASERSSPRLPHLFVVAGEVNLEGLKITVSRLGVQNIHLDMCGIRDQGEVDHPEAMDELRGALTEAFPGHVCVISDEDTTSGWPCRKQID